MALVFKNGGGKKRVRPYPNDRADYNDEEEDDEDQHGVGVGRQDEESVSNSSNESSDGEQEQSRRVTRQSSRVTPSSIRANPSQQQIGHVNPISRLAGLFRGNARKRDPEKVPVSLDTLVRLSSGANDITTERELEEARVRLMGIDQGPLGCYGCTHAECTTGTQDTVMNALIVRLFDFDTANLDAHCIDMGEMYEKLIREVANRSLAEGETPLPPWNPATIKSHILYHTKSFPLWSANMAQICATASVFIGQNLLFKEELEDGMTVNNHSGIPNMKRVTVSKDGIKAFRDLAALQMQLAKIDPKTMMRNAVGSSELMAKLSQTAIIDPTKKKIKTGNSSDSVDKYFNSGVLSVKQDGPPQIDKFGSQQPVKTSTSSSAQAAAAAALVPSSRSTIPFY